MRITLPASLVLISCLAHGQDTPPATGEPADKIPLFRSEVSLVKVDLKATESNGQNVSDLTQSDLVVMDEGAPQRISYFGREDEPLDLLLVADVSASMTRSLSEIARNVRQALSVLKKDDRVALLLFAERTELALPFTNDFPAVQAKLIDSIYKQALGRDTFLNDAIVAGGEVFRNEDPKRRRAMLLITDNGATQSSVSNATVLRTLSAANVVLDAVVVRGGGPAQGPGKYQNPNLAPADVYQFAAKSGGSTMESENAGKAFQASIEKIRARYSLQYAAPGGEPGSYRHIKIELSDSGKRRHPGAVILAREGYYIQK